jgi:hypothetical protein
MRESANAATATATMAARAMLRSFFTMSLQVVAALRVREYAPPL